MALTAEQKAAIQQRFGTFEGYPKERLGMVEYAPGKRLREADIISRVQDLLPTPAPAPAPAGSTVSAPAPSVDIGPGGGGQSTVPAAPVPPAVIPPVAAPAGPGDVLGSEPGGLNIPGTNIPVPAVIPPAPAPVIPPAAAPQPSAPLPPGTVVPQPAVIPPAKPTPAHIGTVGTSGQSGYQPISFTPPGGSEQPIVPGTAAPGQPVMGPTAPFGGVSSDIIAQRNPYQAWTAMRSQAVPQYDPSMGSYAAYEQAIGRGYQPAYGGYMLSSGMEGTGVPGQGSFGEYMAQNAAADPAALAAAFGQVAGQVADPYGVMGDARFANFFDPTALGGEAVAGNLINAALAARGGQGSVLNQALRQSMLGRYGMMQASDPTLTGQQSAANFANLLNQWVNPNAAAIQGGTTGIYGGGQTPFTPGAGTFTTPPIPAAPAQSSGNVFGIPGTPSLGWDTGAAGNGGGDWETTGYNQVYTEPVNFPNQSRPRIDFGNGSMRIQ